MIVLESMGQKFQSAGINTLICIAVVFVVLIFISLLISLFQFIPKAEAAAARAKEKRKNKKVDTKASVEQVITQIPEKEEEELVDDLELVAVIAAAVAAYSGTSSDGFVVRSIRKVKR